MCREKLSNIFLFSFPFIPFIISTNEKWQFQYIYIYIYILTIFHLKTDFNLSSRLNQCNNFFSIL
ncbi:MAG: hypothetical protein N7Q72_06755, partial [Spiroplasma sp. Tabriz.8]|nr:hypothetical protein [Spiroplasma sp. Tabriz.8]